MVNIVADADYPPGPHIAIPLAVLTFFILLHGLAMICMSLGYKFGQKLVIGYYTLISVISLMFFLYSFSASQRGLKAKVSS